MPTAFSWKRELDPEVLQDDDGAVLTVASAFSADCSVIFGHGKHVPSTDGTRFQG